MSFNLIYLEQVKLLLQILPIVDKQECFALKGGTAINLFIRDMPRLSVDIDLTYLPLESRDIFLTNLTEQLNLLAKNISAEFPNYKVKKLYTSKSKQLFKLLVSSPTVDIKIEPNLVLRGSVFPPVRMALSESAQNMLLTYCSVNVLSIADLYAGKFCAALSRQHPRDIFDIKVLFKNGGITEQIRQAFVVYLASGSRPMSELLQPNLLDQEQVFEQEFLGMTDVAITYDEFVAVRERFIAEIKESLSENERKFLLSVKLGDPDFSLMPELVLHNLPALKWKVMNIRKMDKKKHQQAADTLKKVLCF